MDAREAERLYKTLLSEADVLYMYAIQGKCEDAKRVAERLRSHEIARDPYSDDLRFYINLLVDYACYGISDPHFIHPKLRTAIGSTIAKKFDVPLKY